MLFVIYCLDKPGVAHRRAAALEAHKSYLALRPIKVVLSGPLTSDDGASVTGSFFLVDAPDRAAVERFQRDDPLYQAEIWASCAVHAFDKRVDNRD